VEQERLLKYKHPLDRMSSKSYRLSDIKNLNNDVINQDLRKGRLLAKETGNTGLSRRSQVFKLLEYYKPGFNGEKVF
jgi:hypothetical protein